MIGANRWAGDVAYSGGTSGAACELVFERLASKYAEPHRRYHTLHHVAEVLSWVDRLASEATSVAPVRLAAWLHDVVYEPRQAENERASAEWARQELAALAVPAEIVAETARLIETTETHEVASDDRNGHVLSDADLAILGAARERYRRYVADVRAEYSFVPEATFRTARSTLLRSLVERERLYYLDTSRRTLEGQARDNLMWELEELSG